MIPFPAKRDPNRPPIGMTPPGQFPGGPPPAASSAVGPIPSGPGMMDASPSPGEQSPEEESQESGSPPFAQAQAGYQGPQEVCDTCDYFQPPTDCIWVQGPIDAQGRCKLHSAGAQGGAMANSPKPPTRSGSSVSPEESAEGE